MKKNLKKEKVPVKKSNDKKAHQRKPGENPCTHSWIKGAMTLTVLGKKCKVKDSKMCKKCAEEYLNKYATLCNSCEGVIFPGQAVAGTGDKKSKYPYTHMSFECCDCGGLHCGHWGEGKLIPLGI